MKTAKLFSKDNAYLCSVEAPDPLPEVIQLGAKLFVRGKDDKYTEGTLLFVPQGNTFVEKV